MVAKLAGRPTRLTTMPDFARPSGAAAAGEVGWAWAATLASMIVSRPRLGAVLAHANIASSPGCLSLCFGSLMAAESVAKAKDVIESEMRGHAGRPIEVRIFGEVFARG